MVHAVLPLTLLPTYQSSLTYKERIAPVRAGFIYIFYNHKVWREIQISPEDSGEYSLKDVHLYQYRTGRDKPFKDEARIATGVALKRFGYQLKRITTVHGSILLFQKFSGVHNILIILRRIKMS